MLTVLTILTELSFVGTSQVETRLLGTDVGFTTSFNDARIEPEKLVVKPRIIAAL